MTAMAAEIIGNDFHGHCRQSHAIDLHLRERPNAPRLASGLTISIFSQG